MGPARPLRLVAMMGRSRTASKRSAIVGSASVSTWLSMMRAVLSSSTRSSALSTRATRSGRGDVGELAAATLAKELGAVDGFVDGLAEPRGADDPDNVCRAGGNYRLPGGVRLERESLATVRLGQDIVKALRQLAERLGGGGELACLGVQDTRLADASAAHAPRRPRRCSRGHARHLASRARRPGDGSTRPMARRRRGSICVVVQRSTRPPARISSRPSVFSKVDLPPLPIIAVMPGSILSAEARFPLTVSICSPPYNTVIINNHQSSGRTAFALLKP